MLSNTQMITSKNSAENATEALRTSNFGQFFQELEKITEKNQQRGLISYAVTMAAEQRSVQMLTLLADKWMQLCYEPYGSPLGQIIQHLVALSRDDADSAAIGIVTLYSDQQENYGSSLWLILCQSFLQNKKINKVRMLYRYLVSNHEKRQIANDALEQCSIIEDFPAWFVWFVRYLETAQSYSYYDSDAISQKAIAYILEHADFNQLVPHIFVSNTNSGYEKFIIKLFCQALFLENSEKTVILLSKVPATLKWLQEVYKALDDESGYAVFASANYSNFSFEIRENIMRLALRNLFIKQKNNPAEIVGEQFISSVSVLPSKKDFMVEQFCEMCCVNKRHDIAMYLLKKMIIPKDDTFKTIAALVVQSKLTDEDYRFIVQGLDAWPDDIDVVGELERKILENKSYRLYGTYEIKETITVLLKIPRKIVLAENARRHEIKLQENELNKQKEEAQLVESRAKLNALQDNNVPYRNEEYYNLVTQIAFYIKENLPEQAFVFIKKIVSSKYKDEYLKQVAILFFEMERVDLAQSACDLLAHASVQWKEWPRRLGSNKYRKTLDWLIGEADFSDVKVLVQCYVQIIFQKNDAFVALDILFTSKLFSENKLNLESYYLDKKISDLAVSDADEMWTDVDSDIISITSGIDHNIEKQPLEEMIISRFIMQYAESKKLTKKMADFKSQGITGFETAILNYHLTRRQWQNANRLINLFVPASEVKSANWSLRYNEHLGAFSKAVIDYFKTKMELTESVLNQGGSLASSDLRARVLFVLLEKAPINLYQDKALVKLIIKIINQFPEINYQYELFNSLLNHFKKTNFGQKFITIHDLIIKGVVHADLKNRFFIEHVFMQLIYDPLLTKQINIDYWSTRIPFWYNIIMMAPLMKKNMLSEPMLLLRYIFMNRDKWSIPTSPSMMEQIKQVSSWVIEHLLLTKDILLDLMKLLYAEFGAGDKNRPWENDEFIKPFYLLCVDELVQMSTQHVDLIIPTIEHFEQGLSVNQTLDYKFSVSSLVVQSVWKLLSNSVSHNQVEPIRKTFVFIIHRYKREFYYASHDLSKMLLRLIKNNQPELIEELTLLALKTDYSNIENSFGEGIVKPICEYFIHHNQINKVIPFLNNVEKILEPNGSYSQHNFKDKKIHILIMLAEKFASDNQITQVRLIYNDYLKPVRRDLLSPLLDILIARNHLLFARDIMLENGGDPKQILNYRKRIVSQHFTRLSVLVNDDYAKKLNEYYLEFVVFLHESDISASNPKAISVRNQLIVGLKNLLDKAFLAYYQLIESKDPPKLYGKICNFPVPVNESFKGNTPELKLKNFIQEYKITAMSNDLYQYLLQIQPKLDPRYEWLQQLRKMRNEETHNDSYLSAVLEVDGVVIDAKQFLQVALTGIEKILIKLFNNAMTQNELDQHCLSNILSFDADSKHAAGHALGLKQDYSLNSHSTIDVTMKY